MKPTNTLTQFEPTFHQNPMSPGILHVRKTNHLIICAQDTEIPKLPLNIDPKWTKLETK